MCAKAGQLGIIPGSMGARSDIVRGKGKPESFESCSHGAGRAMSRGEAKRRFTLPLLALGRFLMRGRLRMQVDSWLATVDVPAVSATCLCRKS